MKRKILSLVAIIACLFFIAPTSLLAEEAKSDPGTAKPEKKNVRKDKKALSISEISSKKEALAEAVGNQKREPVEKSELPAGTEKVSRSMDERSPQSLADPQILNLNYYQAEIIASAVAKDPDNMYSKTDAWPEIFYSYDSRGNLSQATTFMGQVMADIYYCDGTESAGPFGYFCPKDWIDYIDFDPNGSLEILYFMYTSDTPNTNYYAEIDTYNEPDILFYNINTADGTSVEAGDPLYENDDFSHGAPVMVVDATQVTGYQEGDPLDSDWSVWFDEFDGSRLSVVHNWNLLGPPTTTFTPSTARSIYRFWSDSKQHHFFTISKDEKNHINNTWPDIWNFESVSYKAFPTQAPDSMRVYRFWSDIKQGHFFTISEAEKNMIIATWPDIWTYEGVAYYAYPTSEIFSTPVYRFWSDVKQGHFFTISEAERDMIIATWPDIWAYEGIGFYVPTGMEIL